MTSLPKQRGECLCSRGRRLLLKYPSPHTANKELCNSRATRPLSVLLFLVLCSLQSLPSPSSHHALPLTSHLPLLLFPQFQPLPVRQIPWERSLSWYKPAKTLGIPWRSLPSLPSPSCHTSLHSANAQILTSLFAWPWADVPGGWSGHGFTPTLHVVLQRHNDFGEFWLLLDKFDLVHLFARGRQAKD